MESLTNSSGWFVVTLSSQTLVTALSPFEEGFAGYETRDLIGWPVTKFLADKTVFEMPHIIETVKEKGKWEGEIVYRTRFEDTIPTHSSIMLLSDKEDRHSGYLLLSEPTGLQDSDRNGLDSIYADVGSRVRALVHDLNNPLAVVIGSTQLLTLDSHCTGKMRLDVEKLYSELEKVVRAVEKLHGYAFSLCEKASGPARDEKTLRKNA